MTKESVDLANSATMSSTSVWLEAAALLVGREKRRSAGSHTAANVHCKVPRGILYLGEMNVSRRLITICAWCKKIRSGRGIWRRQAVLQAQTKAQFSHGICPACAEQTYNAYRYPRVGISATESVVREAPIRKSAGARRAVAGALA